MPDGQRGAEAPAWGTSSSTCSLAVGQQHPSRGRLLPRTPRADVSSLGTHPVPCKTLSVSDPSTSVHIGLLAPVLLRHRHIAAALSPSLSQDKSSQQIPGLISSRNARTKRSSGSPARSPTPLPMDCTCWQQDVTSGTCGLNTGKCSPWTGHP